MIIDYWFLVYISRDSQNLEESFNNIDHHFMVSKKISNKMIKRRTKQLDQLVVTKNVSTKIFKSPSTKLLKQLVDNRPCRSIEDYKDLNTGMTHHFYGRQECPYQSSCFSDAKFPTPAKEIWKLLKDKL